MSTTPTPGRKPASPLVLSRVATIRRDNLRTLCDIHGTAGLARKLGYRSPSFLSQMTGPNPTREVTEKSVREFERRLELKLGTLDNEGWDPTLPEQPVAAPAPVVEPPAAPVPPAPSNNTSTVADVIRVIGQVSVAENVDVPPAKFADMVALGFADSMDHGGSPRESFIKDLVHLLK